LTPTQRFEQDIQHLRVATKSPGRSFAETFKINHVFKRLCELTAFNGLRSARGFHRHVASRHPHQVTNHRALVFDVLFLLATLYFEQRWLSNEDIPRLDERRHLSIEEGQQQRANVWSVDIRVG